MADNDVQQKRGAKFWLIILSICISLFMSAFDLTGVSTALPTIINDLHGNDFVWIGSGYALASTALLPLSGAMAEIFGRRVTMVISLLLFALGSALCGAAQNMTWLIAARVVQGIGAGGLQSLPNIIVSDLVPLAERGAFVGLLGLVWAFASATAPLIAGGVASHGQWRWFFYLNVPLSGISLVMVFLFVKLPTPPGTMREKFARVDWVGTILLVASSAAVVIALTWGGVTHPWSSAQVLVPLILGFFGYALFIAYEGLVAKEPLIPWSLLRNRTSVSGYIQAFINPLVNIAVTYYMPVYYQACKNASPIGSAVDTLSIALVLSPFAAIAGVTVSKTQKYRPQLWFSWCLFIIGMGAYTVVRADTRKATSIGLTTLVAMSSGIIYSVIYFPILSPLPVQQNALAMSFHAFVRSFAGVWGVSIGATILQNELGKRLPAEFLTQILGGGTSDSSNVNLAYSVIPLISTLEGSLKEEVRVAFGDSLRVIWQTMTGILGIGLLASLLMRDVPMHSNVDKKWDVQEGQIDKNPEHAVALDHLEKQSASPVVAKDTSLDDES